MINTSWKCNEHVFFHLLCPFQLPQTKKIANRPTLASKLLCELRRSFCFALMQDNFRGTEFVISWDETASAFLFASPVIFWVDKIFARRQTYFCATTSHLQTHAVKSISISFRHVIYIFIRNLKILKWPQRAVVLVLEVQWYVTVSVELSQVLVAHDIIVYCITVDDHGVHGEMRVSHLLWFCRSLWLLQICLEWCHECGSSCLGGKPRRKRYFKAHQGIPCRSGMSSSAHYFFQTYFDQKYGPTWHCIVGSDFRAFVTHEAKHFIFFYIGKTAICLYKAG